MFNIVEIDGIKSNIEQNIIPNALNIIHFQIGSFMSEQCLKTMDINNYRNHEYPKIIELLHNNPENIINSEIIKTGLSVNQISYMIDQGYKNNINIFGYSKNLVLEKEKNKLIPNIVPDNITIECIEDILAFINVIEKKNENVYILINIMDFTSYVSKKLFVNNESNKIHITFPNCLAIDSKFKYIPVIKLQDNNNKKLKVRWINFRDDESLLLETTKININFLDINYYYNLYNFLIENRLEYILYNGLLGLYKLWVLTAYTNDKTLPNGITINLSKIKYNEFADLWNFNKDFQYEILNRIDSYFTLNVKSFINYFVKKYDSKLQPDNDMITIFRIEAHYLLEQLSICKPDIKLFYNNLPNLIVRFNIGDLLKEQNIEL